MKIEKHIEKEKEGTYLTVPFEVPENVRKITISYDYPHKTKGIVGNIRPGNIIDLGVFDPTGRFIGWSGSSKDKISIGEYGSERGYFSQKTMSGKWKIAVGAYRVRPGGVNVTYNIDFTPNTPEWLYGDLHIHSDASDGRFDPFEIGRRAKRRGLDFVAVANHNNCTDNFSPPVLEDMTFLPAVEWTHYKGHMNFFGVCAPFEKTFVANTAEEKRKIVSNAREQGAVISVNHPECPFCPYLWEDDDYDMIEIWNGPMRGANIRAIKLWTEKLRGGRRLPAVGGSDFHKPGLFVKIGKPVTAVYSESRSAHDILEALASGRSFVTCSAKGPRIIAGAKRLYSGREKRLQKNTVVKIKASQMRGERLTAVTDRGETPIPRCSKKEFETEIVLPGDVAFCYIKAVRNFFGLNVIRDVTNPVYFNKE